MKRLALLLTTLVSLTSAQAELTRLDLTSTQPFGTFLSGDYVIMKGKIFGEISPKENIPGLEQVKPNARGNIDYSADVAIVMPGDKGHSNGALIVDIPNRGKAYAQALYNSPSGMPFLSGTFAQGTGFLQDYGFSTAEVYWELGQGADLPSFVDAQGKKQYVEGVGFAIVRDAGVFFAHAAADWAGHPNPFKGKISRTLASGKSQTGRFLKTFLLNGFNMAGQQRVFDGMHVFVSGAGLLPILQTGTGPESSANGTPNFSDPDKRGVHEDPLTISDIITRVEARGEVAPKMMLITSTTDYYSGRASLGRTGPSGTVDMPLPPNVRMYDIAGAPHVLLPVQNKDCTIPVGVLDWTPVSRATLLRLDQWVSINTTPPVTTLLTLQRAQETPPTLRAPKQLPNAVIQVPQLDADNNALGGVRLPDHVVPLGTNGGQNAPQTFTCSLAGSYVAFAKTKAEREATQDQRLSIAERYKNQDDYVNRVRIASIDLMKAGFLLPDDAAIIIQRAAANRLFNEVQRDQNPR
jgi:hypothetical protein